MRYAWASSGYHPSFKLGGSDLPASGLVTSPDLFWTQFYKAVVNGYGL
nr:hypothetical protein [Pseudoclavibacter sp. Marseille-Q3772]